MPVNDPPLIVRNNGLTVSEGGTGFVFNTALQFVSGGRGLVDPMAPSVGHEDMEKLIDRYGVGHAAPQEDAFARSGVELDLPTMMAYKDETVKGLTRGIEGLFKKNKIDYLKGWGSFKDKNTIEVKAEKKFDIPGYIRELETEMANARAWTGAVIMKRRGSEDVDDWYAVMPAKVWAELLAMLDRPTPRR